MRIEFGARSVVLGAVALAAATMWVGLAARADNGHHDDFAGGCFTHWGVSACADGQDQMYSGYSLVWVDGGHTFVSGPECVDQAVLTQAGSASQLTAVGIPSSATFANTYTVGAGGGDPVPCVVCCR